jgi:tetratricopeptide (TPR) repeat protein
MAGHSEVVRALLPVTPLPAEMESKSEEEKVAFFLEDGKRRMREWELMHQAKQEAAKQQAAASTAAASSSTEADSSARFDSIISPEKTAEVEAQAEKKKEQANALYKGGKFAEAIEAYTEAIVLDKMNHVYWSNRSACYLTMKENRQALLDAEVCRRLKPDWPKGCYRLAAARLALGLYEDAAVAAFEGCKLDNSNEELKAIMQKAVKKGKEEHQKKLAEQQK